MINVPELRKQISIFVPLSDWKAIRIEAARHGIPMTELCRRWMARDLQRLREGTSRESEKSRAERRHDSRAD